MATIDEELELIKQEIDKGGEYTECLQLLDGLYKINTKKQFHDKSELLIKSLEDNPELRKIFFSRGLKIILNSDKVTLKKKKKIKKAHERSPLEMIMNLLYEFPRHLRPQKVEECEPLLTALIKGMYESVTDKKTKKAINKEIDAIITKFKNLFNYSNQHERFDKWLESARKKVRQNPSSTNSPDTDNNLFSLKRMRSLSFRKSVTKTSPKAHVKPDCNENHDDNKSHGNLCSLKRTRSSSFRRSVSNGISKISLGARAQLEKNHLELLNFLKKETEENKENEDIKTLYLMCKSVNEGDNEQALTILSKNINPQNLYNGLLDNTLASNKDKRSPLRILCRFFNKREAISQIVKPFIENMIEHQGLAAIKQIKAIINKYKTGSARKHLPKSIKDKSIKQCLHDILNSQLKSALNKKYHNSNNNTPLHSYCMKNSATLEGIDLFLEYLEDDKINTRNNKKETALSLAITHNNAPIVKRLLRYNNIDVKTQQPIPPLQTAIETDNVEILGILLDHYGIIADACGENSTPLIHIAVKRGNKLIVEKLLEEKNQTNVDVLDEDGSPLLHIAILNAITLNDMEIFTMLLNSTKINIKQKNSDGLTAFHLALADQEIFVKLIERDIEDSFSVIGEEDDNGKTETFLDYINQQDPDNSQKYQEIMRIILIKAIEHKKINFIENLLKKYKFIGLFESYNLDQKFIDIVDQTDRIHNNSKEITEMILNIALSNATSTNDQETIKTILTKYNQNIDLYPIFQAIEDRDISTVEAFLQSNQVTCNSKSPKPFNTNNLMRDESCRTVLQFAVQEISKELKRSWFAISWKTADNYNDHQKITQAIIANQYTLDKDLLLDAKNFFPGYTKGTAAQQKHVEQSMIECLQNGKIGADAFKSNYFTFWLKKLFHCNHLGISKSKANKVVKHTFKNAMKNMVDIGDKNSEEFQKFKEIAKATIKNNLGNIKYFNIQDEGPKGENYNFFLKAIVKESLTEVRNNMAIEAVPREHREEQILHQQQIIDDEKSPANESPSTPKTKLRPTRSSTTRLESRLEVLLGSRLGTQQ